MSLGISLVQEIETEVYETNITHNLGRMAEALGIYKLLWRPEEIRVDKAFQLITPLREAIRDLEGDPEFYKGFDAENGWGTYEHFLPWLRELLVACREYPQSTVESDR